MSNSKAAATGSSLEMPETIDEREYRALETVLTQTARGRAFLRQYLTRSGGSAANVGEQPLPAGDTARILAAIGDLHEAIREQQSQPSVAHVRMDILEMARAISRTRAEIAAMRTQDNYDQLTTASEEMDAIVHSTERATNDILQAAERIQEVAWLLREAGAENKLCETIDNCATDIYTACSFQDLTGQRTTKVIRALQYLEARINSMVEIWGLAAGAGMDATAEQAGLAQWVDQRPDAHLLNGPQLESEALGQDNIDDLLGDFAPIETAADVATEAAADAAFEAAGLGSPLAADIDAAEAAMALFDGDEEIDEEKLKLLFS